MKRIFSIDDDIESLKGTAKALSQYEVRIFTAPVEAVKAVETDKADLVIAELPADGPLEGWALLRKLKKSPATSAVPVIILSARYSKAPDIVRGLKEGAEDYVIKPVPGAVLAARVEALFRRFEMNQVQKHVLIRLGPLNVDPQSRTVFINEKPVELTRMEFDLLHYLARRPNKTIPASELMTKVWKISVDVETRTVSSHIYSLRMKLQPIADRLETLPAQGYRLTLP